ncbi:MAG: hypothetical protein SF051_01265, partial [Elusimicrobiota bacterium]|nr:hypothetical protein [Elusimicrobiota bacterium]
MRSRAFVFAAVLASLLGGAVAPARATDPALLAAFERHLEPLEVAILASVLTDPAMDAEFTADMRQAQRDAASLAAATAKWRLRIVQNAQAQRNAANPNLEGTYRTYPEMLSPQIRAYLARRMRFLRERGAAGDRRLQEAYETLRDYLASVQESLDDDGRLSWYTKRVVSGIMDKYRSELVEHLGTEVARRALRDGPAATTELARLRTAADAAAAAERDAEARRR